MDEEEVIPEPAPISHEPDPDIAAAEGAMIVLAHVVAYGIA